MGRPAPRHDPTASAAQPLHRRGHALPGRRPLLHLLEDLQQALQARFDGYDRATSRPFIGGDDDGGPGSALRRLRLGLELLCKLQEELLHPALHESRAITWPALDRVMRDVAALRNLSALLDRAAPLQRPVVVATLEGLAHMHFRALDALLRDADGDALPWSALERETRLLLRRWHTEVPDDDVDADPPAAARARRR